MSQPHPQPPFDELTILPTARRVRGTTGQAAVVDSSRALLVWGPGKKVPVYAFPRGDTALGDGVTGALDDPGLDGYVTVPWDAVDQWYEEDEEIFVHPRDPFVRVDVLRSSRHVRVERDGHPIAESHAPLVLFETGLPPRYYLPLDDVDASLLEPSDHETRCPYKGVAAYHHVVIGGRRHENLLWHYPEPLREVAPIAGYIAPFSERVELIVDGELQRRRATPWSERAAG